MATDPKPAPRCCEGTGPYGCPRNAAGGSVRFDRLLGKWVCDRCWASTAVPGYRDPRRGNRS